MRTYTRYGGAFLGRAVRSAKCVCGCVIRTEEEVLGWDGDWDWNGSGWGWGC